MADINIKDLTTADVAGLGDYDELMRAVEANLQAQYDAGRITGSDFSKVYLGALTQVLQTAAQFTLTKGETSQRILLLNEQIQNAKKEGELLDKQILLVDKQMAEIDANIALKQQQLLSEVQNTALIEQNVANAVAQNDVIVAQAEKLQKDKDMVQENIYNAQAQRVDTVNGVPVAGAIGKQKELYQAQIDGFERDAEQKLTKILLDTWSVSRTTNDAVEVPSNADNSSIDQVIGVARQGIGLTPT